MQKCLNCVKKLRKIPEAAVNQKRNFSPNKTASCVAMYMSRYISSSLDSGADLCGRPGQQSARSNTIGGKIYILDARNFNFLRPTNFKLLRQFNGKPIFFS